MRWKETGWNLNHKRLTPDRDRKTPEYRDLQTTEYLCLTKTPKGAKSLEF